MALFCPQILVRLPSRCTPRKKMNSGSWNDDSSFKQCDVLLSRGCSGGHLTVCYLRSWIIYCSKCVCLIKVTCELGKVEFRGGQVKTKSRFLVIIFRLLLISIYFWPRLRLSPKLLTELIYFSNESGCVELAPATSLIALKVNDRGSFPAKRRRLNSSMMEIKSSQASAVKLWSAANTHILTHTGWISRKRERAQTDPLKNSTHSL